MRWLFITFLVLFVTLISIAKPDTVHSLILKGRLAEARDSLSRQADASTRDGLVLYCQSLLETDAEQSVRLMAAALKTPLASRYREDITFRLAQYYFLEEDYRQLSNLVAEYRSQWADGRYRAEMARFSLVVDEKNKAYESALRLCDRYLVAHNSGDDQQWDRIDKARILAGNRKRIGADQTLRQLSRSRSGIGVSQALYMLGMEAIARNRADYAIFY